MPGRVELLTIRLTDGTLTLTPASMMRPHPESVSARAFAWRVCATCVLTSMRF
jgi:hypothetical protein